MTARSIRWGEVAMVNDRRHLTFLQDFLIGQGVPNEVRYYTAPPAEFPEVLKLAQTECEALRIGRGLGGALVSELTYVPLSVSQLRGADGLIKDGDRWSPQPLLVAALRRILGGRGQSVDSSSEALVVGTGFAARAALAVLIQIGYRQINIATQFDDQGLALIADLKKIYFGVDLRHIPKQQLILLTGNNSVVINTTPLVPTNEILEELYYFNFLKQPGVVIDFVIDPIETPFVKEARVVQAEVVPGYQVAAEIDSIWCDLVFGQVFPSSLLADRLRSFLLDPRP